jgi:hypothetical protein
MNGFPNCTANRRRLLPVLIFLLGPVLPALSQTELEPWGNIISIRVGGQPMSFESSLRAADPDWRVIRSTGRERQRPKYQREGDRQIVNTAIDSLHFTETVEEAGPGTAKITIRVSSAAAAGTRMIPYFSISLPEDDYADGSVQADQEKPVPLAKAAASGEALPVAHTVKFISRQRQLELLPAGPGALILRREGANGNLHTQIYLSLAPDGLPAGQALSRSFTLKASGEIDRRPVLLHLDADSAGRAFAGLGGNFRLQNPKADPQVIDYCLQHLRVAWGRVEMPWRFWQPDMDKDPLEEARAGRMNSRVQQAMEMARRLDKMGIPIILTAWFPPAWAVTGSLKFSPGADGVWGNPIDHSKEQEIYRSIAGYIRFLKEKYGVEVRLFSFNESDLGINIRQTGEEHAALIRGLGAYLAAQGLKTKMLLGDNSDATTYRFIDPAMNDPETHPYIGAISFHSWRGWETEILEKWADAATRMNLPLLVGEGSIDAAAWNYPAVFEEPLYAMEEINLYIRLLAICQPESILQWQLTSDYSPLAGGGIFGNNEPLHPTQRFWNLKQLASTPAGLRVMPLQGDHPLISCAALGDKGKGLYALHLVNNGATRQVTLSGLPAGVKGFRIYITDAGRAMQEGKKVKVSKGRAVFSLASYAYATLISE